MQGKFHGLEVYLENLKQDSVTLWFEKIESLIGAPLCSSAQRYQAYWHPSRTHTCALAIQNAGYQVEQINFQENWIKLKKETV